MGVCAQIEGAVGAFHAAELTDRLGNGQDVRFGKGATQRRAPVTAGAEADPLIRVGKIGLAFIVIPFQPAQVHQECFRGRLTGEWR